MVVVVVVVIVYTTTNSGLPPPSSCADGVVDEGVEVQVVVAPVRHHGSARVHHRRVQHHGARVEVGVERVEGVDGELPLTFEQKGATTGSDEDWKVWVVMLSAPESDPLSRSYNDIFNNSVSLIFQDKQPSLLDTIKDIYA